jgi:nucleoside-diphosphate-sugar epimerase
MPRTEAQRPQPLSPYAVSKLAAEQYCLAAHRVYGLETAVLRYFNVFGERQDPLSGYAAVIPKFIRQLLARDRITIFGDGATSRDFTHVENIVEANLAAARSPRAVGRVINVAMGDSHTLNSLVRTLGDLLGVEAEPAYGPPRAGDVRESIADIGLARELLGYEPTVQFVAGLRRAIDWIAHHSRQPASTQV